MYGMGLSSQWSSSCFHRAFKVLQWIAGYLSAGSGVLFPGTERTCHYSRTTRHWQNHHGGRNNTPSCAARPEGKWWVQVPEWLWACLFCWLIKHIVKFLIAAEINSVLLHSSAASGLACIPLLVATSEAIWCHAEMGVSSDSSSGSVVEECHSMHSLTSCWPQ